MARDESPPSASASASTPLWIASPSRTRDSVSRPRRSLMACHFQQQEILGGKTSLAEGCQRQQQDVSADGLSKSLPSQLLSAFLNQDEEVALEPTTPPHVGFFHSALTPVPSTPRKSFRNCVVRQGKHKPRKLLFSEGESDEAEGCPSSLLIHGDLTPTHQSLNSLLPRRARKTSKRIHLRELR